jgi:exosortase J
MSDNTGLAVPAAADVEPASLRGPHPLDDAHWPPAAAFSITCGVVVLIVAGCLGISREIAELWMTWTTDPLKSIGMLIPPASLVLTLLVWRKTGWEMRGTSWGLGVICMAFVLSLLRQKFLLSATVGAASVSVVPISLPVYLYASGVVLLFAGTRVWRAAWFPLGLLLLSQPVPGISNGLIDLPLQSISAHVARSFATLIGFAPTTPQLRLMFSPDFGMFIAPGCDGMRGAVTMGYIALLLGYLKRVPLYRWIAYVAGAVLLGYLFNFIRLCVLVLYYRAALGHPALESVAKQADYGIGSCLFLVAMFLFLRIARREQPVSVPQPAIQARPSSRIQLVVLRSAAMAVTVLVALSVSSSALKFGQESPSIPTALADRMPSQIGAFTRTRAWEEQIGGTTVEENAAYAAPGSDEVILGVWLSPLSGLHDATRCWLARGLQPDTLTTRPFDIAGGESVPLNTGLYSDGITESIVVNAVCTPLSCSQFQHAASTHWAGFLSLDPQTREAAASGTHSVSIMVRIDRLHASAPKSENYNLLSAEAQKFIAGLDPTSLSKAFQ